MSCNFTIHPIGIIHSPFQEPGQAPRQGRKHGARGEIEIFEQFKDGLKDIEGYTHLIVLFWMDEAMRHRLAATPPHIGKTHGVFATRSPHRPNPIGITIVELISKEGRRLQIRGIDATDGTPVLDIKPYIPDLDSVPQARVRHTGQGS